MMTTGLAMGTLTKRRFSTMGGGRPHSGGHKPRGMRRSASTMAAGSSTRASSAAGAPGLRVRRQRTPMPRLPTLPVSTEE